MSREPKRSRRARRAKKAPPRPAPAAPSAGEAPFHAPNWPITRGVMTRVDRIIPYPNNPRTHPPAQVTFLAQLFKKFGPDQDIVVDEHWVILKGHGRRLAAIEAGLEQYPVTQRFGLSEEDKRAIRIADNQSALLSGWDQALLSSEVKGLELVGYDVKLLGFGEAQLVQFMAGGPAAPGEFPSFDETIHTEHQCPSCGYKWSGKPTPDSDGDRPGSR